MDEPIVGVKQSDYEKVMNLLDRIENSRVTITFNQFIKDGMDKDYKIAKLIEFVEEMQKNATMAKESLS